MTSRILNMSVSDAPGHCSAALPDARTTNPLVERAWREKMVREAAYFHSQRRRPCPGKELEDWFAAEREVDESLGRLGG
jgi:hypothetical protein